MPGAYLSRPDNFGTSPVLYNGLQNQGSTCYLNSVLQVLFMTKDFRDAVERHCCENPNTTNIDLQLKTLFDDLKRNTAYTWAITWTLGIDKVYEQRDAAEYLEKILSLTSPEVSKIFHGELTHRNTCCGCGTHTDVPGPFWSLPLAMMDSYIEDYSVADGIEEFFRPSRVFGDNQLYCDQCDAKADATIECKITDHPEVLMLLMKRFEFDYSYMKYVKINCVVDIPQTVQIPEFSDDTCHQSQTYELYAVVHHSGDLRGGHYTATIKSQDDDRWYEFNDTCVTQLDPQPFQAAMEKSSSAYLLFYRNEKKHAPDTLIQEINPEPSPEDHQLDTSHIHEQCDDPLKERGRVEGEEAAEEGVAVEAVSSDSHEGGAEETEDRGVDSVGSRGAESGVERKGNVTIYDLCMGFQNKSSHMENQDDGRVDDARQNTPHEDQEGEQEITDTCTKHDDLEGVSVEKEGEEERMITDVKGNEEGKTGDDDEQVENGKVWMKPGESQGQEDCGFRQEGKSRLTENQGVGDGGQTKPRDSQERRRLEDTNTRPVDVKEEMKGTGVSKKVKAFMIEEEKRATDSGIQRTSERYPIRRETSVTSQQGDVAEIRQGSMTKRQSRSDEESVKGKCEPKADAHSTLSKEVHSLKLNESNVAEEKKRRTKRNRGNLEENETKNEIGKLMREETDTQCTLAEGVDNLNLNKSGVAEAKKHGTKRNQRNLDENETNNLIDSSAKKARKETDVQGGGVKEESKNSGKRKRNTWWRRQREKKQKKENKRKSAGCFCIFTGFRKNTGSESE
ncbi:uncharacterized protein [Centroberyx affinis]|uniref:uncharacterized protein n=1 Tax=Centroberyx affinis TaxID=166261 RepID=UPI003A5BF08D